MLTTPKEKVEKLKSELTIAIYREDWQAVVEIFKECKHEIIEACADELEKVAHFKKEGLKVTAEGNYLDAAFQEAAIDTLQSSATHIRSLKEVENE